MTTGEMAKAPALFLRNATGLVKGWSSFDAFGYSFLSVNLVTLGMFYSLAVFSYQNDGSPIPAILLSGIAMTFLCITYAGLIAVMPRAGGDYVWQTRILDGGPGLVVGAAMGGITGYLAGNAMDLADPMPLVVGAVGLLVGAFLGMKRGGIGFVLSATGWWFILSLWAPIYGSILKIEFVQPLTALMGSQDLTNWVATADGTFAVSIITILLTSALVALGMAGYARVQRWSILIGVAALAVMFVMMLITSQDAFHAAFDRESQSLFGVSNAYQATLDAAATDSYFVAGTSPLDLNFFSGGTWLLIPFMMFWILYPNWGATLYGEVRGAGDFRKVLNGMLGGTWVTVALAIAFVLLAAKTFGWDFFNASNVNFVNWFYVYQTAPPATPIWGYPPLLVSYLFDNHVLAMIFVVLFGAWFLGWAGTLFLSSTRMIFAAAFDRVLPEWAARVDERRGVPWAALVLIMVPSVVLSWFYAYFSVSNSDGTTTAFSSLTLDASLVIAVTFLGTSIAATILPWWKKDLYQKSPIARYSVAGIPLVSVSGLITSLFLGWVLYEWLSSATYGIGVGNKLSIVFLSVLYALAAILYLGARFWRGRQGIDLDAIHAEIPAE